MKTLNEITSKYDAIIKSKWRLMCEVNCLPDTVTAVDGFLKQYAPVFEKERKELGPKRDNLFLFWKRMPGQNTSKLTGIQLCSPAPDGTHRLLAHWELELSGLEETNEAVKGIKLLFPQDGNKSIGEILMSTLSLATTDEAGMANMWKALPDSERRKPENIVCPRCGTRGSIYIGEFYERNARTYHAATCSVCTFTGPHRTSDYDAMDAFLDSYDSIQKHEEKMKNFQKAVKAELDGIEEHVKALTALTKRKDVSYSNWDVDCILKEYEKKGQALLSMKK